jgi:hypothetical protein
MKKQKIKRCGSIKRQSGISSYDVNHNVLVWIKQLLAGMGFETQNPMKIFCDN